ncbi:MAG: response regulator transcription factor, partial [Treponema sp.]|nr:response regulator transcription factor [Candidatus Treponema equifaecale]
IEDIPEMSQLVAMYIEKEEMVPLVASSAEEGFEILKTTNPDLIILDLNLPGMSGFEFLKKFREEKSTLIPVIIVSARDADEDIIPALGKGADEFVTKPFSPRVLMARVKANLRRNSELSAAAEESYRFGEYTMLMNSCVLKRGSEKIQLSTKEYNVLEFLVKHRGEQLSPETIYHSVWNSEFGDFTAVAVYIQRLRKKIEKDPANPEFLKTVFGMGYMFDNNQKN